MKIGSTPVQSIGTAGFLKINYSDKELKVFYIFILHLAISYPSIMYISVDVNTVLPNVSLIDAGNGIVDHMDRYSAGNNILIPIIDLEFITILLLAIVAIVNVYLFNT